MRALPNPENILLARQAREEERVRDLKERIRAKILRSLETCTSFPDFSWCQGTNTRDEPLFREVFNEMNTEDRWTFECGRGGGLNMFWIQLSPKETPTPVLEKLRDTVEPFVRLSDLGALSTLLKAYDKDSPEGRFLLLKVKEAVARFESDYTTAKELAQKADEALFS